MNNPRLPDPPKFELESYIANYTGMVMPLITGASCCG